MTSVERILEYCSIDQEPPGEVDEDRRPDVDWPRHGRIVFNRVSMKHSKEIESSFALRNISLNIGSGEKVGIVGRTGAGKSSLIQILFRMGFIVEGEIRIDDIGITTIGLNDLRSRISIIPQDPMSLFTGTIRDNLDQFHQYTDEQIWNALEQVCFSFDDCRHFQRTNCFQVQLKTVLTDEMTDGLQSNSLRKMDQI
jgi:ATP-binding cassette subfamily C (CFTR/MRP) protein 4